jgi:hypothetical protein
MRIQLRALIAASLLLPAVSAFAAARPERKSSERDSDAQKSEARDDARSGSRAEDHVNGRTLSDLRSEPRQRESAGRLIAAERTLKTLGSAGRSPESARVLSYAFGVEAGKLSKGAESRTELTPAAIKAIDRLSPKDTAELLKTRGVGRDEAVGVLNRIERLKTDPSFLSGPEAPAKTKSLLADHDQGLSETQLARNEDLADEVYGSR